MSDPAPIAGDFLSLLAAHQVPPVRGDVSLSAPIQTQATTVFAFHFADGILMAGDRRATAGNVIVTDRVDKVIEIDAASLLAIAGVPATAFEMARAPWLYAGAAQNAIRQNSELGSKVVPGLIIW